MTNYPSLIGWQSIMPVSTTTKTMKKQIWIPMLALPFVFAACKPKETVTEKMDAGAEKVAEGVKEMAKAAGDEAAKAKEAAAASMEKAGDSVKEAVKDVSAAASDEAAKAKAAADEAAQKVKEQAKEAVEDAKEAVEDAMPE